MDGVQQGSLIGSQFGNYRLSQLLGKGGFAEVYLGVHIHLETLAAIKVLHAQLGAQEQTDFLAEARTVARLKHPHIIQIREFGIEKDVPFLVMNYSPHGTLRQHFPRGRTIPLSQCLPYLKQIASALQYAHDEKCIHRDIKPANMLVGDHQQVFLSDFGIAVQARSSRSQTVQDIIGTVRYMSPEQLRGRPRPASDQYSLAVVAYEWLCGYAPFTGDSYLAIAKQHALTPPPSLRAQIPTLSEAVEKVIFSALAKDSHYRYTRVLDFVEALEEAHLHNNYHAPSPTTPQPHPTTPFVHTNRDVQSLAPTQYHTDPSATPTTWANTPSTNHPSLPSQDVPAVPIQPSFPTNRSLSRRSLLVGAGLTSLAIVGGGSAWWFSRGNRAEGQQNNTGDTNQPTFRYLTEGKLLTSYKDHADRVYSISWSADSKYLVSSSFNKSVHLWDALSGAKRWSTTVSQGLPLVSWSPDGKYIGIMDTDNDAVNSASILTSGHLWIYTADNPKEVRKIDSSLPLSGFSWSYDSKLIAILSKDQHINLELWNWQQSPTSVIAQEFISGVSWHPQKLQLLSIQKLQDNANTHLVASWDVNATNLQKLQKVREKTHQDQAGTLYSGPLSPNGEKVIVHNSTTTFIWDYETLGGKINKFSTDYGTLWEDLSTTKSVAEAWSPDSKYIAIQNLQKPGIFVWDPATDTAISVCNGYSSTITNIAWSPNGKYLAASSYDQTVYVWQVAE